MIGFLTGLALLASASAALDDQQVMPQPPAAAPTAQQQQQANATAAYYDQMICVKEEDTGSRLTSHKVCRTRSQWAQIRQDQRSTVEHIQQQRPMDYNGK